MEKLESDLHFSIYHNNQNKYYYKKWQTHILSQKKMLSAAQIIEVRMKKKDLIL